MLYWIETIETVVKQTELYAYRILNNCHHRFELVVKNDTYMLVLMEMYLKFYLGEII